MLELSRKYFSLSRPSLCTRQNSIQSQILFRLLVSPCFLHRSKTDIDYFVKTISRIKQTLVFFVKTLQSDSLISIFNCQPEISVTKLNPSSDEGEQLSKLLYYLVVKQRQLTKISCKLVVLMWSFLITVYVNALRCGTYFKVLNYRRSMVKIFESANWLLAEWHSDQNVAESQVVHYLT